MRVSTSGARKGLVIVGVALLASLFTVQSAGAQITVSANTPGIVYEPPVDGAVIDGWRPPEHEYGSGNRGLDFATPPGGPVKSPAVGVVSFVGQVGGTLWVVIRHPDGLRSSLGPVRATVTVGQTVTGGQIVGTAVGASIHWGVRRETTYVDPGTLLGSRSGKGRVRLTK